MLWAGDDDVHPPATKLNAGVVFFLFIICVIHLDSAFITLASLFIILFLHNTLPCIALNTSPCSFLWLVVVSDPVWIQTNDGKAYCVDLCWKYLCHPIVSLRGSTASPSSTSLPVTANLFDDLKKKKWWQRCSNTDIMLHTPLPSFLHGFFL